MSLFTGKGRVHQYEQVHDISHLENLTMRSLTLTGAALLMGMLLSGCGTDDSPTAPLTPDLAVEDAGHNAADHFKVVEAVEFEVESPCNGELITFSGTNVFQITSVDTREALDAGFAVHFELQSHTRATGTGSESGVEYTINDIFHDGVNSPSPLAPQFTFSFGGMFHVTSDLPGLSFDAHFGFHGLALPSGEFKLTRELDRVECKA